MSIESLRKLSEELQGVISGTDNSPITGFINNAEEYGIACTKAYEILEHIQEYLRSSVSPSTGEMDADATALYNKLTDIINDLYTEAEFALS